MERIIGKNSRQKTDTQDRDDRSVYDPAPESVSFAELPEDLRSVCDDLIARGCTVEQLQRFLSKTQFVVPADEIESYFAKQSAEQHTEQNIGASFYSEMRSLVSLRRDLSMKAATIWHRLPEEERDTSSVFLALKRLEVEAQKLQVQTLKLMVEKKTDDNADVLAELDRKIMGAT